MKRSMAEVKERDVALDVKHLARPKTYDGAITKEQSFREWRFTLENYLTLIDETYLEEMGVAEEREDPITWTQGASE